MSQTHPPSSKPSSPTTIAWWKLALCFVGVAVALVGLDLIARFTISSSSTAYETSLAKILESKRVVDHTIDSQNGGRIIYRFEAHVIYPANGQKQDRWLPLSADGREDTVLLKVAAHPIHCLAYWPPGQPESAKCSLK